jgi:iron complex outermembrane receptor protein
MGLTEETRDTVDLDFQLRFFLTHRHEFLWGGGFRTSRDHLTESSEVTLRNPSYTTHLANTFLQDDILLVPNRLKLTLGAKVEYSNLSDWDLLPNGRLAWTPHESHFVWGSVARAARPPARLDQDGSRIQSVLPPSPLSRLPIEIRTEGNPDFGSETLVAYELGYRTRVIPNVTFDVVTFYNDYDDLQGYQTGPLAADLSPPAPRLVLPVIINNSQSGDTYGVEVAATWEPVDFWRLRANYSFLEMQLSSTLPGDSSPQDVEGQNPQHQFFARSSFDLPGNVEWDVGLGYVGPLSSLDVDGYVEMDVRLAWKPHPNLELSLVGANLLHSSHAEFQPVFVITEAAEVPRSVYGQITWRY